MNTDHVALTDTAFEPTQRTFRFLGATHHLSLARGFGIVISLFFVLGLAAALLMRIELMSPTGWLVSSDTFHKLFSLHGMMMVYFVLLPAFPAILGLALLPGLLGLRDFAFPRLNRLAAYAFGLGGALVLLAALRGGSDAGWAFAAPYSFLSTQPAIATAALGVLFAGLSYVLLAVNIIATVHVRPSHGERWTDLPMFAIGSYAGALAMVVAAPTLCMAMVLVLTNRLLPFHLYEVASGGNPTLFNQLFWFSATPALYAIILPAAGAICDLFAAHAQRPIAARRMVALSMLAMAVLSLFLWGRHLLTSEPSPGRTAAAVLLNHVAAAPFIVIVVSWLITVGRGARSFAGPYVLGLVVLVLLVAGGLTGLALASPALNPFLHNTVFVVAHFHVLLVGGALTAFLAAVHQGWPTLARRPTPEISARIAAVLILAGVALTFLPLFLMGAQGLPRRHHVYPVEFQALQVLAAAGTTILFVGFAVAGAGLLGSLLRPPSDRPSSP